MKTKFFNALTLALIMAMLITSLALADNIVNDITVGGNDTITAGSTTTVGYKINTAAAGDTQAGCNASDGTPVTITLSVPNAVSASTTSLTFTVCNAFQYVTFSSNTGGNYPITVASWSDSGTGSYKDVADFTLHVFAAPTPSDTTPPIITFNINGTLGNNGWYVSDVFVSWDVVDNESSITSTGGCDDTTINADTVGVTLTCEATSAGGTRSESVTIKRDATAPTISSFASPAPNGAGWNNTDVVVTFTCDDNLSGVVSCGPDATLSNESAGQSATGMAVDNAGNSASETVDNVNIDKTAPTASASVSPAANEFGWNNTNVTVSFDGSDGLSGIASCDAAVVLSSEGAGQSTSGTCTDKASNVSDPATATGINIDKTPPTITWIGGPQDGASYYFGFVPVEPVILITDGLSGPLYYLYEGSANSVGTNTIKVTAYDKAGNSYSESHTYTVLAWTLTGFYQPVDMNGVWNTVKGGSTVPFKFEVFAGSMELTDTAIVQSFSAVPVACPVTGVVSDAIEFTTSGGTSLRYDWIAGQFINNWQTPKKPGACYIVTMTTQDGSTLSANFKLK